MKLTALLLLVTVLAAGVGVLLAPLAAQQTKSDAKSATKPAKEKPAAANKEARKPAEVQARVVGPDGKAVKGAKVYRVSRTKMDDPFGEPARLLAESDAAGRCRLPAQAAGGLAQWLAAAEGFGPGLVEARVPPGGKGVTFRLVKDLPIEGRIVNLEGQPVPGVVVRPFMLGVTAKEDLAGWLEAVHGKKRVQMEEFFPRLVSSPAGVPGLPRQLTTDRAGRFRLSGAGRERIVALMVSGPKVEAELIAVMTRAGKPLRVPEGQVEFLVYPATFQHPVSPPRPLLGSVREARTGKPIAGATIDVGLRPLVKARTKADGTFRLDSLPGLLFHPGGPGEFAVTVVGPADQPYLPALKSVRRGPRREPLRADFTLPRGLWAEGKLTDKRTGKPVRAAIEYLADIRNPRLKDYPDYPRRERLFPGLFHTKADGSFRIPVLPGAGALIARVASGAYLPDESLSDDQAEQLGLPPTRTLVNFHAVARIEPKADATSVKCDLTVDPGRTLVCQVIDPEGKPVKGAWVRGLLPWHYQGQRQDGDRVTLRAVDPKKPRWLVVLHPSRQLGASLDVKAGDGEPLSVRLGPTGTITGRVLTPEGRPWKQTDLRVSYNRGGGTRHPHQPETVRTDDEGRFRVEGIIPGLSYQVDVAGKPPNVTVARVASGLVLKAPEVKALGDVKARRFSE
jgi:protocatechuate 3,4-dioxygenase beta subunit